MKKIYLIALMATSMILASCGGSTKTEDKGETAPVADAQKTEEVPSRVSVTIEGNDLMQFNLNKIEVVEGQTVSLTLKHVGQMSGDVMGHNWVLLKPGTDTNAFGQAAVTAKETGYVPDSMKESVVIATKVVGGGESVTIEFEAPAVGYYDFICSFPGHYSVMKGSFVVQPK